MSTLKISACLLVIFNFIIACSEQDDAEPVIQSSGIVEPFEATMEVEKISGIPLSYSPNLVLEVQYIGNGVSNRMGDFNIKASHLEQVNQEGQEFRISDGQFVIDDLDGNSLFGSYSGSGSSSSINHQTWYLRVEGGIGEFAQATGLLTATLKNEKSDLKAHRLEASIRGILNENPSGL